MNNNISESVKRLIKAENEKLPCQPVREFIGLEDLEIAYEVQKIITRKKLENGERLIGRKIGLTSHAVQSQLGVDQPDYGSLFQSKMIKNGSTLSFDEVMQPKVESEIAFVLKESPIDLSFEALIHSIDYASASIEIAGSRIENWNIKITDTIADNASASHFVLGPDKVKVQDIDLIHCEMKMFANNELVSSGKGSDCLGSPLIALQWLAKKMHEMGEPLQKGDIVLSGALGPMYNPSSNDHLRAEITGLGEVSFHFNS